jgi:hypothetical protein
VNPRNGIYATVRFNFYEDASARDGGSREGEGNLEEELIPFIVVLCEDGVMSLSHRSL